MESRRHAPIATKISESTTQTDRHGLRASVPHTRRGARFRGQWIAALGGPLRNEMTCLDLTYSSVAENLALDEALLIEADAGRRDRTLRFWEPADYAVVLGASRRLQSDVRVEDCRADGVPVLRRTSGGGTVVVGPGTLNVSVILPESAAPGLNTVDREPIIMSWTGSPARSAASGPRSRSTAGATW